MYFIITGLHQFIGKKRYKMMTKTEQNMLDMARNSAETYKRDLERLQVQKHYLKGYLEVFKNKKNITEKELELCLTILEYLK